MTRWLRLAAPCVLLGAVLASTACLGVWVAGIEPPGSLRDMVGTAPKTAAASDARPSTVTASELVREHSRPRRPRYGRRSARETRAAAWLPLI